MVERINGFLETSFLPGRSFASPADFNAQLADWLVKANSRTVRSIAGRPVDTLETELPLMVLLPPVDPVVGLQHRIRLGRDTSTLCKSAAKATQRVWRLRMVWTGFRILLVIYVFWHFVAVRCLIPAAMLGW